MELNKYQSETLRDLAAYLEALNSADPYTAAYKKYWENRDVKVGLGKNDMPPYNDALKGTPHVCFKVPTGGGKTFLACAAVKTILNAMPLGKSRAVVWLVPSNAILEQTLRNLSNPRHPYRQRLDRDFSGRVALYSKEQLLGGQNFSPSAVAGQLSICVLSYDSIRSKKKDGRKLYQENSQLAAFAKEFSYPEALVEGVDESALIQVLNQLCPLVIVDESHNAQSDLSVEMLRNLNPAFVLDLTATPKENSNIISYVDARELKRENMVKLPVVVYNRQSKRDVLVDAIGLRNKLEAEAKAAQAAGGPYIRPVVLFQAQPKGADEAATFEKLKEALMGIGLPKEEIAIKTSAINELKNIDLLSETCPIRYIITVNALKEGWDCPFAYILATLANKTSKVDVEQIVGRVLRQPYAQKHAAPLNLSYVLTCSNTFFDTLNSIVAGLNRAGFSRKDVRVSDEAIEESSTPPQQLALIPPQAAEELQELDFADVAETLAHQGVGEAAPVVEEMITAATQESAAYEEETAQSEAQGLFGTVLGEKMNQFFMRPAFQEEAEALLIPQFFEGAEADLFHDEKFALLDKEALSAGFSLKSEDIKINFALSPDDIYTVDITKDNDAVPNYKKLSAKEIKQLREFIATSTLENKKARLIDILCGLIEQKKSMDCVHSPEIRDYVKRVVDNMEADTLASLENSPQTFAHKIHEKIEFLLANYSAEQFKKRLDTGDIFCRPAYRLPKFITPVNVGGALDKSLYTSEVAMNNFEQELIAAVAAQDNIKWWHKIAERKDYSFHLNGFINHYPDFLLMTHSGKAILIEAKGDNLDNSDSVAKLYLGNRWVEKAGEGFQYFMVFQTKDIKIDKSYALDEFIGIAGKM